MEPRRKSAALWGAVGALLFLVLVQGYRLYAGEGVGLPAALAVAVGVGAVTTGGAYLLEGRLG